MYLKSVIGILFIKLLIYLSRHELDDIFQSLVEVFPIKLKLECFIVRNVESLFIVEIKVIILKANIT